MKVWLGKILNDCYIALLLNCSIVKLLAGNNETMSEPVRDNNLTIHNSRKLQELVRLF